MFALGFEYAELNNVTVSGTQASGSGAGVYLYDTFYVWVRNSVFKDMRH